MPQHPLRQSLRLRVNYGRAVGAQLGLQDSAQGVDVRRERAKKAGLSIGHHQQGGKVVHLHRVYQIGLVFDVYPDKLGGRELGLQLVKQRPVVAAGAAPLSAQTGHQQVGGGGGNRGRHGAMMAESADLQGGAEASWSEVLH